MPKTLLDDIAKALDRKLPVPLSVQLKGLIEYGISCGQLAAGARLPSVRQLANAGGIAPMTAVAVYRDLRAAGLIEARLGAGTFVASSARADTFADLGRVRGHLDAALAAGEAAGLAPWQVASILNARTGLGRAREGRAMRLVMLGVFPDATRSYACEIERQLRIGDTIEAVTFDAVAFDARPSAPMAEADLVITLAHRQGEAERLLAGRAPVTSVSLLPSERTQSLLAGIDPAARVGIAAVFPEFLGLMKSGVLRFAPHVRDVSAIIVDDADLEALARQIDVLIYASGAERACAAVGPEVDRIEYLHAPDARAVHDELLPLIETIRAGSPHACGVGSPGRSYDRAAARTDQGRSEPLGDRNVPIPRSGRGPRGSARRVHRRSD